MANARRVSSAFDRTIISLPLSEYAWSPIIPNEAAIHWNREQSSDLSAVLEYAPYTNDGSIQLRIVQATRTIVRWSKSGYAETSFMLVYQSILTAI